jgi:hypothetical protein
MINNGIGGRKAAKMNALKNFNEKFKLGYTDKQIENLSTAQLRKILLSIRLEHKIPVHPQTRIPKSTSTNVL